MVLNCAFIWILWIEFIISRIETATSQEVCPCNTTLYDQLNEEFHQTRDLLLYRDKRLRQKSRITRRRLQEVEEAIKMKWNTTNLLPNAGQMRIEPNNIPKSCQYLFDNGMTTSGVYLINPGCGQPLYVFCDMERGGWIIFQRRNSLKLSFNRPWMDYYEGFGDVSGEHWLGLKYLHCLADKTKEAELRIDFTNVEGIEGFASYDLFTLSDDTNNYRINLGEFKGSHGDTLQFTDIPNVNINGQQFSTPDRDNDKHGSLHCARKYQAGWWLNACSLFHPNSNPPQWGSIIETQTELQHVEMKLRFK